MHHHRLRQDAAVVPVVAAEAEDQVGVALVGHRHQRVVAQALLQPRPAWCRGSSSRLNQIECMYWVLSFTALEEKIRGRAPGSRRGGGRRARGGCRTRGRRACRRWGPARSCRPGRCRSRAACRRSVPASRQELAVAVVGERLDQGRDVVRVAGDDLDEAVLAGHERLVVDAAGVGLAEAELAALGEEAPRARSGSRRTSPCSRCRRACSR